MMDVSIVVPAYNEELLIEKNYREIKREIEKITKDYEIIIANDGSKDSTEKILKRLASKDNKLKVISYYPNRGMGYAQRQIYNAAQGNMIIHMDADLSMKPSAVFPEFMRILNNNEADIVVASKYVGTKGEVPFTRLLPSRIFYLINLLLFGFKVKDYGSGFFAIKKDFLKRLNLKSDRFEIHVEFYAKLKRMNARILEIPAKYVHRERGQFSVLRDGSKMLLNSLKIRFGMLTGKI